MFSRYGDILALPGARTFFWWGLFSRLQIGMTSLATFLLVQIEYGSYATAGLVVGVLSIGAAIINPQISRLVDEHGQSRVLRFGFGIAVLARLVFVAAALMHAPTWALLLILPFFAAAGAQSTLTRARWTHIVPDRHALNSAFSLESSMEEVLFIAGPALSTILATQVASWLPSIVAAVSLLVGGYYFLSLRDTEPPARRGDAGTSPLTSVPVIDGSLPRVGLEAQPRRVRRYRRPLRGHLLVTTPALILTSVIFATQGALFASADASTVAFSEELGQKQWSGTVLAIFALGSLIGGLLYGSRVWSRTLASRLLWGVTASGIGALTFHLAGNLAWLAVLMFVTGLAIAPTMAVGDGVVHALVPRTRVTEGMAWTRVGLDMGVAFGAWATGLAIDSIGSHGGFMVTGWAGAVGIVLMLGGWRYLRRKKAYEEKVSREPAARLLS
ncbi:MFS transporter [Demequina capsici]|uniref:MFS transporter n=1 Tax=Demequina capsici TaxID=3075620 RepID=A0AA96F5S8_9MICO|nr:MFS transporter [Demequina sp. OYTSA14]WNM24621.1 MFS transporter [Demequina sp. OYTSA14]